MSSVFFNCSLLYFLRQALLSVLALTGLVKPTPTSSSDYPARTKMCITMSSFICIGVLATCMSGHHMCAGVPGSQNRTLGPLEPEVQTSHHMGAGDLTLVLTNPNKCP